MLKKLRYWVYLVLESNNDDEIKRHNLVFLHKFVALFISVLIFLNIVVIICESEASVYRRFSDFFYKFEVFSVVIFSIEYILRLWVVVCKLEEEEKKKFYPLWNRIKYIFSPLMFLDLIAILPFYLPFIFPNLDLRILRILRISRIFRIFRINTYLDAWNIIIETIKEKKKELILSLVIELIALIVLSSLMYYVENPVQPDKFSSIPETMWWAVITLTTIGYGDVYPITNVGKFITALFSILGIAMFALPAAILTEGFSKRTMEKTQAEEEKKFEDRVEEFYNSMKKMEELLLYEIQNLREEIEDMKNFLYKKK